MKKFFKRVAQVIKYTVAIFIDFIFPVIDLLQMVLLLLPIPNIGKIVVMSQKYEDILIKWVAGMKEIGPKVEEAAEKVEEKEGK